MSALDLSSPKSVHVVGVGGAGMSAIATVLVRTGHRVSGSDLRDSAVLERLRAQGVTVGVGHDAAHVPGECHAVVISTAVPPTNPEVVAAGERGIPVLRRADALAAVCATRRTVAVSGTHGKTTTSSMLALALRAAGMAPSFIIGGEVNEVGGGAVVDGGEWLVVEADESDGTFVELPAEAVLVTNVEPDHLEHWGGFGPLQEAFREFVKAPTGPVVVCADDPGSAALASDRKSVTYGFSEGAGYRAEDFEPRPGGSRFTVAGHGAVELPSPGRHNALNALGALAMAMELGASFDDCAAALGRFGGVSRRFQFRGEVAGATVVDDYAHLPSEVRAAIGAAREGGWQRVVVVFQPHRYSRTATLWQDFAGAFDDADLVVLTDIYSAGEDPRPGVSGRLVLQAVLDAGPRPQVMYFPHRGALADHVRPLLRPGDVLLTLGAGDITHLAAELATP